MVQLRDIFPALLLVGCTGETALLRWMRLRFCPAPWFLCLPFSDRGPEAFVQPPPGSPPPRRRRCNGNPTATDAN